MNRIWVRLWLYILGAFFGLAIAIEIPNTLVRQFLPGDSETFLFIADLLGTLVLSILFTAPLAWTLAQPLRSLSKAARQVAEGDLSARVGIYKGRSQLSLQSGEVNRLLYDFNAMATSLERLEAERLATTAAIAHELRTPLAVLRARLAALRDGVFELDSNEIPLLLGQTDLLTRLVEDLRHLSLADAGKLELAFAPCDLAVLAKDAVAGFEPRAGAKGVRLEVCAEEALLVGDAARLRQVITNLLDNALKFTPETGCITVTVRTEAAGVTLRVRDTGPGLAEGVEARVFERFYHSDAGSSGSGLGLAIVKLLVELHGGQVEATNAPEGGAVFRVSFSHRHSSRNR